MIEDGKRTACGRNVLGLIAVRFDAATKRHADAPPVQPAVDLVAAIEAAHAEVEAAEATLRRVQDYGAITADRDRCVAQAHRLAAVRTALHEAEKRTEHTIGELYRAVLAPLIEPASRITQAVTGRALSLYPSLGWRIDLGELPVEHLSESDAMVVGVALHAAVVLTSRSAWRALLLDGAEAIEAGRRGALLQALAAEAFDTVVVAAVDDAAERAWQGQVLATTVVLGGRRG